MCITAPLLLVYLRFHDMSDDGNYTRQALTVQVR